MNKNSDIGLRILDLRKKNKLNQEDFVVGLEITRAALSGIETGAFSPSIELLRKIVAKYHVSWDYLMDGDVSKPYYNPKREINTNIVAEPKNDYCRQCDQKDQTIDALKEINTLLKEKVAGLVQKLEKGSNNQGEDSNIRQTG